MAVSDYDTVVAADSPVHYWKMDGSGVPLTDSGSGGKNFTTSSNITFQTTNLVAAYPSRLGVTSASSGIVSLSTASTYSFPGGDLTASIFVRSHGTFDTQRQILSGGTPWSVQMNTSALYFAYRSGGVDRTVTLTTLAVPHNTTTHVIVRVSGTSLTAIANGRAERATLAGTIDSGTNQPITIVGRGNIYSHAAIFHSALSDARITQHVRAARAADATAPLYMDDAGSATATGDRDNPLSLEAGFSQSLMIGAGGTIYVKEKDNGDPQMAPAAGLVCKLWGGSGSKADWIKVKPEPGVWRWRLCADNLGLGGGYGGGTDYALSTRPANLFTMHATQCRYVQIYQPHFYMNGGLDTATNRGRWRPEGIIYGSPDTEIIGPIIHDLAQGIFSQVTAHNMRVTGFVIMLNGEALHTTNGSTTVPFQHPRKAGHATYNQNDSVIDTQIFEKGVAWGNFNFGVQVYGTNSPCKGIQFSKIFSHTNGDWGGAGGYTYALYVGGTKTLQNNAVTDCMAWNGGVTVGVGGDPHRDISIQRNVILPSALLQINDVSHVTFNDNLVINHLTGFGGSAATYIRPQSYAADPDHGYEGTHKGYWTGTGNTYAGNGRTTSSKLWHEDGQAAAPYTLSAWQSLTGIDLDATIRNTTTSPYTDPIIRYAWIDELPGEGFIAVYNPTDLDDVTVDLSDSGLTHGQAYTIMDVQDLFGTPAGAGVYNSGAPTGTVSMEGTTVQTPVDYTIDGSASARTSRLQKAFMVVPGAAADGVPDPPTDLDIDNVSNTRITVNATIDAGASSTTLEYRENGGSWQVESSDVTLPYNFTPPTPGAVYEFRLKSTNVSGDSLYSDIVTRVATVVYPFGARPQIEGSD